jgi:hypothetical protein
VKSVSPLLVPAGASGGVRQAVASKAEEKPWRPLPGEPTLARGAFSSGENACTHFLPFPRQRFGEEDIPLKPDHAGPGVAISYTHFSELCGEDFGEEDKRGRGLRPA